MVMGAAQLREELHQFINRADERVLNLIYGMMRADIEAGEHFTLSDEHRQLLDERLEAHKSSPDEGSSWKEVKDRIKQKA
jgi:putative addiction module component (TIGR02574 family)